MGFVESDEAFFLLLSGLVPRNGCQNGQTEEEFSLINAIDRVIQLEQQEDDRYSQKQAGNGCATDDQRRIGLVWCKRKGC